ncbi:MAG: acyl-CoA dehydrogenase family protein, partial [Neisseriaceae bacterium]|nr:acyl-CoA dehydrogenase family protein [Neisseriaceae bacterium]
MLNKVLYRLPEQYSDIKKKLNNDLQNTDSYNSQRWFYSLLAKNELSDTIISSHPDLLWALLTIGESFNDQGLFLSMGANFLASACAIKHYSEFQIHEKILPDICSGKAIVAFAATESDAGSDVMGLSATYKNMSDHYLLNGEKSYITNALTA